MVNLDRRDVAVSFILTAERQRPQEGPRPPRSGWQLWRRVHDHALGLVADDRCGQQLACGKRPEAADEQRLRGHEGRGRGGRGVRSFGAELFETNQDHVTGGGPTHLRGTRRPFPT